MRVCVVGAGAIGGLIGTRLAAVDVAQVSALARGATLSALREHGWRLETEDGLLRAPANATDRPAELGVQDLVILAVKSHALPAVASQIAPLLGDGTLVLPAINGVPWWFCHGILGLSLQPLESVDPGGAVGRAIPYKQVIGCVVHASAAASAPGLVRHRSGHGLIVGEPRGGRSERAQRITALLAHAGFEVTHSADIRHEVWYKLWGNMTMNPVSVLTGATIDQVLADSELRAFCSAAMLEANAIGRLIGVPIEQSPEDRHAITARLGAFKTSMLQDVEAGRPIELDGIVGAVHEIGRRLGVSMPAIGALLGLTRLMGRTHGVYPNS